MLSPLKAADRVLMLGIQREDNLASCRDGSFRPAAHTSASKSSIRRFVITEKARTRRWPHGREIGSRRKGHKRQAGRLA